MSTTTRNYWNNLVRLLRGDRFLRPLVVAYYVTTQCNLDCAYCEDFGARRNPQADTSLPLDDALRVLGVIRSGVDSLILTGGEPLLYPDILPLVTRARHELNFRHVTLLTNGSLLPQHETLLPALDRLVISLDSTDPEFWSSIIHAPASTAQAILDNVRTYAGRQRELGYRMVINCVLTPETLLGAQQVLDFCVAHGLYVSFSPQAIDNWPRYDLLVSDDYKTLLAQLIVLKRRGAPILGSMAYLRTLLDFRPYSCYPTLVPRIMPNGDLLYPCRPIEKRNGSHGGRVSNLLEIESWDQALEIGAAEYGPPPRTCTSCFQQCFAEPSLMQARPLSLLHELLFYPASRRGGLTRYAPG
ncbi:MAG: radical SAM protein [Chloroflexota bacterium]|nr:radical SAM protein [Chloroflexota bacterium]